MVCRKFNLFAHHAYFVQFYKVEPDDKVGIISVQCSQVDESKTEVAVTYHYIGISEKGNEFIINDGRSPWL